MRTAAGVLLAERTTLRLGGPAASLVEAETAAELVTAVRDADARRLPALLLGAGSNVVVADEGFDGLVVAVRSSGIDAGPPAAGSVSVRLEAGEDWDCFVALAVRSGWAGVEALAGIPGTVGAAPIQNVGAYGQEVSDIIDAVHVWDRKKGERADLPAAACGFGYRTSRFKEAPGRFVVLAVTFRLHTATQGSPVRYAELAERLDVRIGERAPVAAVRTAVLGLRRRKGMVLDADDHDTWSAGSFFTNPLLPPEVADRLPAQAPRWRQPDGRVKTSAAWLLVHAGFARGYGNDKAQLSSKHPLAVTNRGGASAADVLALAREVRAGVAERYGIRLVPEPVLVGCSL